MKTYAKATLAATVLFAVLVVLLVLAIGGPGGPEPEETGVASPVGEDDGPASEAPRAPEETPPSTLLPREEGPATGKKDAPAASPEPSPPPPLPEGSSLLALRFRDRGGRPVAGAMVRLRSGRAAEDGVAGRDGEVAFSSLAAGLYSFLAESPGRPVLVSAHPIALEEGEEKRLEITLVDYRLSISGRVIDENGEAVPGIEVVALRSLFQTGEEDVVPWKQEEQTAVSGGAGGWEIAGLEEGEYEVRTVATERYPSVQELVRAGADAVDLVVSEGREVRVWGVVTDEDGRPLDSVSVTVLGQAGRGAVTGEDGVYELQVLASAERHLQGLRFRRKGLAEKRVTLQEKDLEGRDELRVDARLSPLPETVTVGGVLVTGEGAPVAGETLHLHSSFHGSSYRATSGPDGRFVIPDVRSGLDYRLWIRPRGPYQDYDRKGLRVREPDDLAEVVLETLGTGTIAGRMVDPAGTPVPRFSLWLQSDKASSRVREVVGDEQGFFILDDVPEGHLVFQTRSEPRISISGLELEPGEEKEAELVVDWGSHRLSGRVLDELGNPLPGAKVYASWFHRDGRVRSTSMREAVADATGSFLFARMGPGSHRISASAPGYRSAQKAWEAGSGGEGIELRLEPAAP